LRAVSGVVFGPLSAATKGLATPLKPGVIRNTSNDAALQGQSYRKWLLHSRPVGPQLAQHFLRIHTPGLPVERAQFFRLGVSSQSASEREHLQVMTHYPVLSTELCDALADFLRPMHPQGVLSFVRSLSEGFSEVRADSHLAEVAAAVTETMRSGSWDESQVFRIVAGSHVFGVTIRWVKDHAEAAVTENAG